MFFNLEGYLEMFRYFFNLEGLFCCCPVFFLF